ncbi:hypothetical protein HN587_06480 [Candidatus Woesearchaeota archaeon]|jgi:hypothetical protein|nr:hypothetical protein [Candidatus Woesearchaeota archaeon]
MILVYGYKAIKSFGERGEQVEYISLKSDLENAFKGIKTDYGSIKRPVIQIPGKFKKICFVEPGKHSGTAPICQPGNSEYEPLVCSGWEIGRNNVFLCPDCSESFNVEEIEIVNNGEPYICFETVANKINLQIEGKGDRVKITKY